MTPNYGGYARQKADTQYKYSQEAATNAYGRFLSQQRGTRNLGDMSRNYQRQFPKQTAGYARRGIAGPGVKSGLMQQSMNNYVGDYNRQYGRAQQDLSSELQGFDLSQANLDSWRQRSLADIEAEKQRAIANDAAQIDYLRQTLGGL